MELYGDEKIFDLELKDGTMTKALGFWGVESVFSNFHPCSIEFTFRDKDREVGTSEQMFMLFKANMFRDFESAEEIIDAPNPMMAKSIGREVKNYDDRRWSLKRYDYMKQSLFLKFSQNAELCDRLLKTGDMYLVEASPYDSIWGVKLSVNNSKIEKQSQWKGDNLLGKALMEVREMLENSTV